MIWQDTLAKVDTLNLTEAQKDRTVTMMGELIEAVCAASDSAPDDPTTMAAAIAAVADRQHAEDAPAARAALLTCQAIMEHNLMRRVES